MTFNTGNPIGSTDSRDRLDNTENMDYLENSTTELTHPDRLGTVRKTRHGMEVEHDAQISAHEVEHDAQIAAHKVEHDNQMQSFETDFDDRLAGMAFTRVGSFTSGATLTDMRQVLIWDVSQGGDGHEYSWAGAFPKVVAAGSTPATTGEIGAGAWVDRTDVTLRSEINIVVKRFASVADMVADTNIHEGMIATTTSYIGGWNETNHQPIGGGDYVLMSVADATAIRGGGSWVADGLEDFYSSNAGLVWLHKRSLLSSLELSSFGASRYRTESENYSAIMAAWKALTYIGSGTIIFEDMYDIGANSIVLVPANAMGVRSSYAFVGKTAAYVDQQTDFNPNTGCGIRSSAGSIIKWGDASSDMSGRGLIKDLTIYSTVLGQIGLDFSNEFGGSNILCDLDNVRLIDFEGASSFIINQGRCVDSVWSNIKLFGKGTQPFAGIKITRELPTLISPQFNYCGRSLYVTAATNAFFNVLGGWSIQPAVAHICFAGGAITHQMTSSAHGFSMLETTSGASTPILCVTPSGCSAYLSLSGCQMDSSLASVSGRAIDFQCGGRLKLDNCKLNPSSTARNIKVGSFTVLTVVSCDGFTMEDSVYSQVISLDSGMASLGTSLGLTGTNTVPTSTKNGFSYLDNGANTARKRAGWRFYDTGSGAYLDMHPQFESKNTLTGTPNTWVKTYMPDGTAIWLHATTTAPA